jgi:cell division protein FtsQ
VHGGRRRRLPWRGLLLALAVAGLAAAAGWVVLASSLLGVDRVTVSGASAVAAEEVVALASVAPGTPLARVDTGAVAARVAALPRLESVEVHRRWPGTLAVVVTERVPLAVERTGAAYAVLDDDGVALQRAPRPPRGLPVLEATGERSSTARGAALAVLDALPPDLRAQVQGVRATGSDDVRLALAGERTVVWGSADRGARKAVVLRALLGIEARTYDVTAPDVPTTR